MRILVALMALAYPIAREPTAKLRGVVVDQSQAHIPGSKVILRTLDGPDQLYTVTDDQGQFAFDNVVPGSYTLDITQPGFEKKVIESIRVDDEADIRLAPIVLKTGPNDSQGCPTANPSVMYAPLESRTAEYSGRVVELLRGAATAPLSHVTVSLWLPERLRPVASVRTQKSGEFDFRKIKPGNYFVKVSLAGYNALTVEPILIKAGSRGSILMPLPLTPCSPSFGCRSGTYPLYEPVYCQ